MEQLHNIDRYQRTSSLKLHELLGIVAPLFEPLRCREPAATLKLFLKFLKLCLDLAVRIAMSMIEPGAYLIVLVC